MDEDNLAGNIEVSYDSDLWEAEVSYLTIQDNFNAEMGYVRRTNIRNTEASFSFSPRPQMFPSVRQVFIRIGGNYLTDQNQRMLEAEFGPMLGIRYENSSRIYMGMEHQQEFVDEDWEVRPGFIVPIEYRGTGVFLQRGPIFSGTAGRAGPRTDAWAWVRAGRWRWSRGGRRWWGCLPVRPRGIGPGRARRRW